MQLSELDMVEPAALAPVDDLAIQPSQEKRAVFSTQEHADTSIPLDLVISGDRLNIYPDLLKSGLIRANLKDGRLSLQAGGWIGFVPLNDKVALEILPRVPIGNLERVLSVSGASSLTTFSKHLHQYEDSRSSTPESLLNVLAERLASLTEACWNEGLHFEYRKRVRVGQNPRGRLKPFATAMQRIRSGDSLRTVSELFERTHDTAPNRCLYAALSVLYTIYSSVKNRKGARPIATKLWRARSLLANVSEDHDRLFLDHTWVLNPEKIPASRPSYPAAIALAKVVLSGTGLKFRSNAGQLSLPPMMLSMEAAFEAYLRNVLASNSAGIVVLDGNSSPPDGASTKLFHSTPESSPAKTTRSTPDIVCHRAESPDIRIIIDVKYKPDTNPSRDDLNQVLSYALSYRSSSVLLAYPRKSSQSPKGLHLLGEVSGVRVHIYFVDLAADDLPIEEQSFVAAMAELLLPQPA